MKKVDIKNTYFSLQLSKIHRLQEFLTRYIAIAIGTLREKKKYWCEEKRKKEVN
jgi:hypothetical protein